MTIEAAELMDELHVDQDPTEIATFKALIDDAQQVTLNSVSSVMTVAEMEDKYAELFDRAVKTLVASMYYDRELTNGTSKGFQLAVVHLATRVAIDQAKGGDASET